MTLKYLFKVTNPDSFLNGSTRLAVPELSYFFKVSPAPDFENKIPLTVKSGFEPQNLLKICSKYCYEICDRPLSIKSLIFIRLLVCTQQFPLKTGDRCQKRPTVEVQDEDSPPVNRRIVLHLGEFQRVPQF